MMKEFTDEQLKKFGLPTRHETIEIIKSECSQLPEEIRWAHNMQHRPDLFEVPIKEPFPLAFARIIQDKMVLYLRRVSNHPNITAIVYTYEFKIEDQEYSEIKKAFLNK